MSTKKILPIQPLEKQQIQKFYQESKKPSKEYWYETRLEYDVFKKAMIAMGFQEVSENHSLYSPVDSFLRKDKNTDESRYTVWIHPAQIVLFSHSYVTKTKTSVTELPSKIETVSNISWYFKLNVGYQTNFYNKFSRLNLGSVNVESLLTGECLVNIHGQENQGSYLEEINKLLIKLSNLNKKLIPFDEWENRSLYLSNNLFYKFKPQPGWESLGKNELNDILFPDIEQQKQAYFNRIEKTFPAIAALFKRNEKRPENYVGIQLLNSVESLAHYFQEIQVHRFPKSKKSKLLNLIQIILDATKQTEESDFSNISSKPVFKNIGFPQLLLFYNASNLMPYLKTLSREDARSLLTTKNESGRTFTLQILHQVLYEKPFLFYADEQEENRSNLLKRTPIQTFFPDFIQWGCSVLGEEQFAQTFQTQRQSWSGEILGSIVYKEHLMSDDLHVFSKIIQILNNTFIEQNISLPKDIIISGLQSEKSKKTPFQVKLDALVLEESDLWKNVLEQVKKKKIESILSSFQALFTKNYLKNTLITHSTQENLRKNRL